MDLKDLIKQEITKQLKEFAPVVIAAKSGGILGGLFDDDEDPSDEHSEMSEDFSQRRGNFRIYLRKEIKRAKKITVKSLKLVYTKIKKGIDKGRWEHNKSGNAVYSDEQVVKQLAGILEQDIKKSQTYNAEEVRNMVLFEGKLNEAKTFKPGDMWSKDFDYVGMMKYASKVHLMTGFGYLKKLYDSLEDVNYHSENKHLGMAIDAIENGQKNKAEKHLKAFNKAAKKTLKSMKEGVNEVRLNEFGPGPFGISMAVGILLKALYKWAKANRKDKQKLKDFVKKL